MEARDRRGMCCRQSSHDLQRGQGLSYVEQRLRPGPLVAPEMACDIWSNVLETFEKAPPDS